MGGDRNQSIVSFGGGMDSHHGSNDQMMNEQTLNKQGKKPIPQKMGMGGSGMMPMINPKELSNEELEFIIKTGSLPPRLNQTTN